MTLFDTGPMLALIDPRQVDAHRACRNEIDRLRGNLVTTWPCITEAMYLSSRLGGPRLRRKLWSLLHSPLIEIEPLKKGQTAQLDEWMTRYANVPMDFADASLVLVAEVRNLRRILTLDSDFRIYRLSDGSAFDVIPA